MTTVRFRFTAVLAALVLVASSSILLSRMSSAATVVQNKGISTVVYDYWASDADAIATAHSMFTYMKSLGANAVSLNFNFYSASSTDNTITSGPGTPSPARLGLIVNEAKKSGLRVELRPLMEETSLKPGWRGSIAPTDPAAWFASYTTFLTPYLQMAKTQGVADFVIGAELTSMVQYQTYWTPLINFAKSTSKCFVMFDANWEPVAGPKGAGFGLDFYRPVWLGWTGKPTVTNLAKQMHLGLTTIGGLVKALPPVPLKDLTLGEVGISAVDQAWLFPGRVVSGSPIVRSVQANWFTAACQTFKKDHLRGIYYWALFMAPGWSPTQNDAASAYEWMNTDSAKAIKTCFTTK